MPAELRGLCVCVALLVSGCATLSETECRGADWLQLGERDGAQGYAGSRLEAHAKACAEHGLQPDEALWKEGYEAGLLRFCEPDNGYRLGRNNGYYAQVCPLDLDREFVAAYEIGNETYEAERELEGLRGEVSRLESRLASDKQLSNEGRVYLRREINRLYYELSQARRRVEWLDDEWRRRRP